MSLWLRRMILVSCVLGLTVAGCGADSDLPLDHPIVLVHQKPVDVASNFCEVCLPFIVAGGAVYSTFSNFTGPAPEKTQPLGSYLVRLDPDGSVRRLSPAIGAAARDPEVSWDGERVVFSMRRGASGKWQIYEVDADGSNLRRISQDERYHDYEPAYLPDGRILFLSDRLHLLDPIFRAPSAQLHVMEPDGENVIQLSTDPGGELNPTVTRDGSLLFTRWNAHYPDAFLDEVGAVTFPPLDRFLVWKTALDGTSNAHPLYGEHSIQDFTGGYVHVREDADGTLLATLTEEYGTFGSGGIVRLDPREHADIQRPDPVTPWIRNSPESVTGRYRSPYPLQNHRILAVYAKGAVSEFASGPVVLEGDSRTAGADHRRRRPAEPHFKLVLLPADGHSDPEVIHEEADLWMFSPVELVARPVPPIQPGTGRSDFGYGILNAKDVYLRDVEGSTVENPDEQPIPAPGEAVGVRIFRLVFTGEDSPDPLRRTSRTELLGIAPVESDGSFAAVVPAGVPLFWETFRADGTAIVSDPFLTEVRPGQIITCNGCHTPHDGTAGRTSNAALARPVNLSALDADRNRNGRVDLLER